MLYKILMPIVKVFMKIIFWYKEVNKPEAVEGEALIICANHISNWDPILIMVSYDREIHMLGKIEMFKYKLLAKFFSAVHVIPVDRQGNDVDAVRKSLKVLKENNVLGIFPEGTRIKDPSQKSRERFNDGIALIASKSKADILPVTIKGKFTPFSKIELIYHDRIKIENYKELGRKEMYTSIVDDVYNAIYQDL